MLTNQIFTTAEKKVLPQPHFTHEEVWIHLLKITTTVNAKK